MVTEEGYTTPTFDLFTHMQIHAHAHVMHTYIYKKDELNMHHSRTHF